MARVPQDSTCHSGGLEIARGKDLPVRGAVNGDRKNRGAGEGVVALTILPGKW
jgi:hypothetical protein